jgi:hypothetical protein
MQRFIIQENIQRFNALLRGEIAPGRKALIESLLEDERSKFATLEGDELGPDHPSPGDTPSN